MRIVLLTSSLNSGGAERVASTLCNAWAARGDHVTLIPTFSGGGSPFYKINQNVELVYLADVVGGKNKNILSFIQRLYVLRRLIQSKNPDVVISFLPNVNVAAILAMAFLKTPLLIGERTDPTSRSYPLFWKLACRFTYRFADILTVQTESVANKIGPLYPGLKKIRSISNPLPDDIVLRQHKPANDRKVLLSLGRLATEKQVDHIITAFSRLASDFSDWVLYIYGEGLEMSSIEKQVQSLQLQGRVLIKGPTSNPWDVMSNSSIFIMTSKFEGFPNALLESMGVGLPCIAYDCPSGPRDITRGGVDAILVPLNDEHSLTQAMKDLMGNPALRRSLGVKARESVLQRYQLSSVVGRWDELFGEVGVKR